jgi:hypothetical protein
MGIFRSLKEKDTLFAGYNLQNLNAQAMENLAWECPLAKGPAVFTARVLMNKLNTDFIRYCNSCETLAPNTGNNQRTGVIQPKPYQYDESEANDLDILAEEKPTNTKQFLGVNLYPNPAQNLVNVESKESNIVFYELSSPAGIILKTERVQSTNFFTIDVSKLSSGFYILKFFNTNNQSTIQKFNIIK